MLKGIDNRLNAEVLACLRAMGHGDVLIVADTNFPSDQVARATVTGELLRMGHLTCAQAEIDHAEGSHRPMISIERFAFYDMARQAYAVIQTGERRFYGCFMFRKGVIPPEA